MNESLADFLIEKYWQGGLNSLSLTEKRKNPFKEGKEKFSMVFDFRFPDVGEGIAEGEIVRWRVDEGEMVRQDQILVEIETDKAVVEIPSPREGVILKIHHKEGDTIKVGEVLVTIGEKGEKVPISPAPKKPEPAKPEKRESFGVVGDIPEELPAFERRQEAPEIETKKDVMALPAVRRLAKEMNVDLLLVQGTGGGGRITEEDVRKSGARARETPAIKVTKKYDMWGYVERMPLKGIRKATAVHMREAVSTQALVTHMDEADVTELFSIREKEKEALKSEGIHLTFMPFIIKAVIKGLLSHPYLNSSLEEGTEEILLKKYYNIGIAVDLEGGLIVPVIKGADQKPMKQLAKEIKELADKAKDRKLDLADLKGGTFTITNVGALGGLFATPIPNYPESAIVAMGKIIDKPVVAKGTITIRKILPLSLSFDHRVLDGAEAARFMNEVKKYLEDPDLLLVD